MKINLFDRLMAALLFAAFLGAGSARLHPCSTFLLKDGKTLLAGHNLDERVHFPGAVFINQRGVRKKSASWASLLSGRPDPGPPLAWISRYASVTFNAFGRDFPDDGMNEAGLFVGEMTLTEAKFPEDPAKPRLFMCLWTQHLLDTCETVQQVIASASATAIDGWGWHFFAADRSGATAVIEFLNGSLVVHEGETMPVPVLCNNTYEREMQGFDDLRRRAADDPGFAAGKEIPRFVQAAVMLERFGERAPRGRDVAVAHAFDILAALERGGTQWSFVCDLGTQEAWFRTARSPKVKRVDLKRFPKDCARPARFLDIHADLAGDVSGRFAAYSPEGNRKLAEQALAAVLAISPGFEKVIAGMGQTMDGLVGRFAAYPGTGECVPGKKRLAPVAAKNSP